MSEHREETILLGEWNTFVGYFTTTGIGVGSDVTDPDDGRVSKNTILGRKYDITIDDSGNEILPCFVEDITNCIEKEIECPGGTALPARRGHGDYQAIAGAGQCRTRCFSRAFAAH